MYPVLFMFTRTHTSKMEEVKRETETLIRKVGKRSEGEVQFSKIN